MTVALKCSKERLRRTVIIAVSREEKETEGPRIFSLAIRTNHVHLDWT